MRRREVLSAIGLGVVAGGHVAHAAHVGRRPRKRERAELALEATAALHGPFVAHRLTAGTRLHLRRTGRHLYAYLDDAPIGRIPAGAAQDLHPGEEVTLARTSRDGAGRLRIQVLA